MPQNHSVSLKEAQDALTRLIEKSRKTNGGVEKYIYDQFRARLADLNFISNYASTTPPREFSLSCFFDVIEERPGLKRSVDKVYEIVVYSLFEPLIEAMEIDICISVKNPHNSIFTEFESFSKKIFGPDFPNFENNHPAKLFRVGITNAADGGLDMWGNFGLAIQIKHLTISEQVAENIVEGIRADRIVIVCKNAEEKVILSIISQLGWKGRIQAVITLDELNDWYDKAMRGEFSNLLGQRVKDTLIEQIGLEFPATSESPEVKSFFEDRGYND